MDERMAGFFQSLFSLVCSGHIEPFVSKQEFDDTYMTFLDREHESSAAIIVRFVDEGVRIREEESCSFETTAI